MAGRRACGGARNAVIALGTTVAAQPTQLTADELRHYTPLHTGDRFEDGRPRVSDAILQTFREMAIEVEEAYGVLRENGFVNQYEANWQVLLPDTRLVGRASTVQYMPTRPDLNDVVQKDAEAKGMGRLRNQTTIDMLQRDDVAVVDLYGKVEGGTFVGDKLAYYIQKTTGTGVVVDGGLFYLRRLAQTGVPAYGGGDDQVCPPPSADGSAMTIGSQHSSDARATSASPQSRCPAIDGACVARASPNQVVGLRGTDLTDSELR
jgi:4-hydroxy-4-methyl-2-oxoglutarate aldolase